MNYGYMLKNNKPSEKALLDYGFTKTRQGVFSLRKDLPNGLYVVVEMTSATLNVDVWDSIFNEKYAPFTSGHGGGAIKSEVRGILEDIFAHCCNKTDWRNKLLDYLAERYGTQAQRPWADYPDYCTFKAEKTQKWYAILMNIPEKSLGLLGDNVVDVVNVKLPPQDISQLVDGKNYFPAYHMNKKYWMTVLLNEQTDFAALQKLLDTSYNLVCGPNN